MSAISGTGGGGPPSIGDFGGMGGSGGSPPSVGPPTFGTLGGSGGGPPADDDEENENDE